MRKLIFLLASLLFLLINSNFAFSQQNSKLIVDVKYPENQLSGQKLFLRGDGRGFLNEQVISWGKGVELTKTGEDVFTVILTLQKPFSEETILEFKAMIGDKKWQIGANAVFQFPKHNSTRVFQIEIFPYFFTSEGKYLTIKSVYSEQLKNRRDVAIYLPPSFEENPYKIHENIFVMHDGQNLFNVSTSFMGQCWYVQNSLNDYIFRGAMEEIIVIGVNNGGENRISEMTYSKDPSIGPEGEKGGNAEKYLNFIEQTILKENVFGKQNIVQKYGKRIERIEKNFDFLNGRVRYNPKRIGIMGSSLGGLVSCYAGFSRLSKNLEASLWHKVGCMSSSFWWNKEDFLNDILGQRYIPPPPEKVNLMKEEFQFYLDSGDQGDGMDDKMETLRVMDHLQSLAGGSFSTKKGTLSYYLDKGAGHSEYFWSKRFWRPITYFYPVRPTPVFW